jgi:hypothetical protein
MLTNILQVISLARVDIGYCQGMNFITGTLLFGRITSVNKLNYYDNSEDNSCNNNNSNNNNNSCNNNNNNKDSNIEKPSDYKNEWIDSCVPKSELLSNRDESIPVVSPYEQEWKEICESLTLSLMNEMEIEVFEIMMELLNKNGKFDMANLWQSKGPKMKLRVFQFDNTLKWLLPKLHSHFIDVHMAPEVLVAQWFATLFTYALPFHLNIKIWNCVFLDGWSAIFRITMSLLQSLEEKILSTDLEGIGKILRSWKKINVNTLSEEEIELMLQRSTTIAINDEVLQQLQEMFALEMIRLSEKKSNLFTTQDEELKDTFHEDILSFIKSMSTGNFTKNDNKNNNSNNLMAHSGIFTSGWLDRYGIVFSDEISKDMLRIRDELVMLDKQVESDKNVIQSKIIKACEECRLSTKEFKSAMIEHNSNIRNIADLGSDVDEAIHESQLVSSAVTAVQSAYETAPNHHIKNLENEIRNLFINIPYKLEGNKFNSFEFPLSSSLTGTFQIPSFEIKPLQLPSLELPTLLNMITTNNDNETQNNYNVDTSQSSLDDIKNLSPSNKSFVSSLKSNRPLLNIFRKKNHDIDVEIMKFLSQKSQQCQQKIILINRTLNDYKYKSMKSSLILKNLEILEEESLERKNSLCNQLQRLVEDSKRYFLFNYY